MNEKCESGSCGKCGNCWCKIVIRVLIAAVFIYAGYGKIANITGTAAYIASAGLPWATGLAWASGLLELVAGVLIVAGFWKRYAAWVLIVFTVAATYLFHFKAAWAGDSMQVVQVLKNLAIVAGLAMLAGCGCGSSGGCCGKESCDKCEGGKCEHR